MYFAIWSSIDSLNFLLYIYIIIINGTSTKIHFESVHVYRVFQWSYYFRNDCLYFLIFESFFLDMGIYFVICNELSIDYISTKIIARPKTNKW